MALHSYTIQAEIHLRAHGIEDASERVAKLAQRLHRERDGKITLMLSVGDDIRCDTCAEIHPGLSEGECSLG